jgi:DNA-binding FadR family transcriptional regulator
MTNQTSRRVRQRAHELVAAEIRQQIVRGELVAGQRLPPEEALTEQFGIARTTLREALRVLESQGLLKIRRGRNGGPVVTHPDLRPAADALAISLQLQKTTLTDLDSARRLIETRVARELALHHEERDLVVLDHAIQEAAEAAELEDAEAFGLAAARVHQALMESTGNNTITTIASLLTSMVTAYYRGSVTDVDQLAMRRAVRAYRKLLRLIRAGDADGAEAHWDSLMAFTITGHDPAAEVQIAEGA